jgi:hypothetical protein
MPLMGDEYWPTPRVDYDQRRRLFLDFSAAQVLGGHTGFFSQISRLALGRDAVDEGSVREALAHVESRRDCSDFTIAGLLRILYLLRRDPALGRWITPALVADIERTVLGFRYWWDEPGEDPMCYWTENHQALFHSDELLAGALYPDRTFTNTGTDGRARVAHALPRLRRWLELRARLGYSEWLSNCYFDEDLLALLNLHDFATEPDIRRMAGAAVHLLLFEVALHSYRGVLGCTHGRTYADMILGGRREPTASTAKLALGMGIFNDPSSLSAVAMATGSYRPPEILAAIAADAREMVCRERHGIELADADRFGLRLDELEDGVVFWGMGVFIDPRLLPLSMRMVQEFRIHQYGEFQQLVAGRPELAEPGRLRPERLVDRWAMTEVHVETYRSADVLLSCAQDFRAGRPGYQQHVWQATLGLDAVVFTNHPGADDTVARPSYWAGNGVLPRAAQHRSVLVCLHRAPPADRFPFSHAYFPRAAFDETAVRGNWTFGRRGDGYVALWSDHAARAVEDGAWAGVELRAEVPETAWICELGDRARWGEFAEFVGAIAAAEVGSRDLDVAYHSPHAGLIEFGWHGPLRVGGREIDLHSAPRFDSPFARAEFGATEVTIDHGGAALHLDLLDRAAGRRDRR